ncbi:glucose-1-phosphate cytidylyltransferase [Candidatus Pelagibacter sp.]|nr:glucose-1-phosphate cytidylyltransferase [Candidatus Pelagibacter sp.]
MKLVILAGGIGTRISEESHIKPKPMIEIGGKPIIWHIMKMYSSFGINEFIICCGYKGEQIKRYFADYYLNNSDVEFNLFNNDFKTLKKAKENWKVTTIDTGQKTMTGGRLSKIKKYINDGETFFMTYGDGVGSVNIKELLNFHKKKKKLVTMTIVKPPGRFGMVKLKNDLITEFVEKPSGDGSWINGGFFVLEKKSLDLVSKEKDIWERKPLETLAKRNQLAAYKHNGFWKAMDTLRDKIVLDELWVKKKAPWKLW